MRLIFKLLDTKYLLSLIVAGVAGYMYFQLGITAASVPALSAALSICAQRNYYAVENSYLAVWFANLYSLLSFAAPVHIYVVWAYGLISLYLLYCVFVSRPLTPEEQRQQKAEYEAQKAKEEQINRENRAKQAAQEARTRAENMRRQNTSIYGFEIPQLPPGGYKHLLINAKLKDGTFAQFQTTGLEHQVRAMVNNDPRFEYADVGLLSRDDYGRYGTY